CSRLDDLEHPGRIDPAALLAGGLDDDPPAGGAHPFGELLGVLDALQREPADAPAGHLGGDPGQPARPEPGDDDALDLTGRERLEAVAAAGLDAVGGLPAGEVAAELRVGTVGRLGGDHPAG